MIAAGLAARRQREREVVRGVSRASSDAVDVGRRVSGAAAERGDAVEGLGRRMSRVELREEGMVGTVAPGKSVDVG